MATILHRFASLDRWMVALIVTLAVAAAGCAQGAAPGPTTSPPKTTEAAKPAPQAEVKPTAAVAVPAVKPEKTTLKIGLPALASSLLPANVIAEVTGKDEGLAVQVVNFGSGAAVAQALVGGSVDFNMSSVNGLVNAISAGQPVKGVYAGFHQADFDWLAKPSVKSWADLKGKSIAVSSFGSLTDFLTRYALRKHGLEPERDVQMVQAGSGEKIFQALKAGKIDAGIIEPPFKWQAADEGFVLLGKQSTEVGEAWPKHVIYAKEQFIKENPNTVRALLRAHVRAIRLMKTDREFTINAMMNGLKWDRKNAERAYDDVIGGFDERGSLPTKWMPVFWEIAVAAGDAKEAWPESKLLDRSFIDSFDQWAPK